MTDVAVTQSVVGGDEIAACVVETATRLRIEAPPQGAVTYQVPFDFTRGEPRS